MLAYLTQDGQIDYTIVHKLDRLARNLTAHACTPLPHTTQENNINHYNHTT